MTDKYVDIRALIQENDEAREQYEDANPALEEAVRARNREVDPKPGEVWEIIATPRDCPHEPIPAIMGEWEWHVAPFLAGGSSTLHPMLAYPTPPHHPTPRHPRRHRMNPLKNLEKHLLAAANHAEKEK